MLACSTPDEEILKEAASAIQEHLSVLNSVKDSSSRPAETFQEESKEREKRVEREEKTSAPPMRPRVIRPLADVLPQRVTPMEPETEQKIEQKTEVSAASDSETKMNEKMNEKTETKNETTLGVEVPTLEFEELNVFTDTELRLIFSSCGQRDAILSLLGAEPGFVEAILALLPKAEADQVRRKLSHPGRIRLTEVENARERVLQAARQLMIQGKIQVPEARNATV